MPCRDELRVHLRKEKWLNNLSIISKTNIIEFSEFLWHCYSLSIRNNSSTGYTARAILTISNDESPYFQSSPLPHPVAVPEACRLARSPPWDQKQGQAQLDCPCAALRPPAL
ncbi:hypothetical protein T4C_10967 [Trichinella pseudospiralis]|uniref:Uncharacterized protein n=2 Tax=Trichinella pseudospiralis TaxID=6337 RepID=A0A0V1JJK1_TRIPS|nr:hypothetical protein T4C_10967 [Trichinella pseudospiralis]